MDILSRLTTLMMIGFGVLLVGCKKDTPLDPTDPMDDNPIMVDDEVMPWVKPHDIQIRTLSEGPVFTKEDGSRFDFRGTNFFDIFPTSSGGLQDQLFKVGHFDVDKIRDRLSAFQQAGYTTIRVFLDTCNDGPNCMGNTNGKGLNESYLKNIVNFLDLLVEMDLYVLFTSNDLPDHGGYWDLSNQGASEWVEGYRNAHYLTEPGVNSAKLYWTDLLTGLIELDADFTHVLGWSILNEQWYFNSQPPFNLSSGQLQTANGKTYDLSSQKEQMAGESIQYYVEEVIKVIKEWDPNGLVTIGYFAPNRPHIWRPGDFKYVEIEALLANNSLDFYDFHLYPGTSTMAKLMENMVGAQSINKPIIMGEVGTFIAIYKTVEDAGTALQYWMQQSCDYGFQGWLTWGLERAPEAIGDATWGLEDEAGWLRNHLSPLHILDPCDPQWGAPVNLALNQKTQASSSLMDEPSDAAVDGDPETQWGSGDHPEQWIEIDLGERVTISSISLLVAQWPAGETVHEIAIGPSSTRLSLAQTLKVTTEENDRLTASFDPPISGNVIRVTTKSSPSWVSWKEIEVYE